MSWAGSGVSLGRRDDDDDWDDEPNPPSFRREIVLAVTVAAATVATERLIKWGFKKARKAIKARREAIAPPAPDDEKKP